MDIIAGTAGSYIATGFFTPNYRSLAESFSVNLTEFGVPHHFYAIGAKEWVGATLAKPACIMSARRDYPAATIIGLDVDCRIRGPIEPVSAISSDVGLNFSGRIRERRPQLYPSTRVTVWRPTVNAQKLLNRWNELCQTSKLRNDELLLMEAILETPAVAIEVLPWGYRGFEPSEVQENSVILHESARAKEMPKQKLKRAFRALRHRLFEQIIGVPYDDWKYGVRP